MKVAVANCGNVLLLSMVHYLLLHIQILIFNFVQMYVIWAALLGYQGHHQKSFILLGATYKDVFFDWQETLNESNNNARISALKSDSCVPKDQGL